MVIVLISIVGSSLIYQRINDQLIFNSMSKLNRQTTVYITSNIENVIDSVNAYSKLIISNENVEIVLAENQDSILNQQSLSLQLSDLMETAPFIKSMYLFDLEGNMYSAYRDKYETINPNYMNSNIFKRAIQDKGRYSIHLPSSDFFTDYGEQAFVSFVRAIRDLNDQEIIGVLVINIPTSHLIIEQKELTDNQIRDLYVIADDNVVIHSGILEKSPISHLSFVREKGYVTQKIHEGKHQFFVSSYWIEQLDWYLVTVISMDQTSQEMDNYKSATVIIYMVNLVFIYLGVALFSRFFVKPINQMIGMMRRNGENLEPIHLNSGIYELNQLEIEYNEMITKIKALIKNRVNEQKSLRNKELELLQAQIKPHFLYNTLDTIKLLAIKGENEMVFQAVKALGKFYRTSLGKGEEAIRIADEMDIVTNYLKIQNFRYKNIFELEMYLDPCLKDLKILRLILQPLVENALYHGIRPKGEKGIISVKVCRENEAIVFIVEDDGVGFDTKTTSYNQTPKSKFGGYGVKNTIERLKIYYGNKVEFNIESAKGVGTKICITIPESVIANPVGIDEMNGGGNNA